VADRLRKLKLGNYFHSAEPVQRPKLDYSLTAEKGSSLARSSTEWSVGCTLTKDRQSTLVRKNVEKPRSSYFGSEQRWGPKKTIHSTSK